MFITYQQTKKDQYHSLLPSMFPPLCCVCRPAEFLHYYPEKNTSFPNIVFAGVGRGSYPVVTQISVLFVMYIPEFKPKKKTTCLSAISQPLVAFFFHMYAPANSARPQM